MRLYDLQPGDWIRGREVAPVRVITEIRSGKTQRIQGLPKMFRGKISRVEVRDGYALYVVADELLWQLEISVVIDRADIEEVIFVVP